MSRVLHIYDFGNVEKLVKSTPGFVAIVYIKENDHPSQLFMSKCAEYSRVYPFIIFAIVHIKDGESPLVFRVPLAYVPTTAFFRDGKQYGQLVGTDWLGAERILTSIRASTSSQAPVSKAPTTIYQPPPSESFVHKRRPEPKPEVKKEFPFIRSNQKK